MFLWYSGEIPPPNTLYYSSSQLPPYAMRCVCALRATEHDSLIHIHQCCFVLLKPPNTPITPPSLSMHSAKCSRARLTRERLNSKLYTG